MSNYKNVTGFLVVLSEPTWPKGHEPMNPRYKGADRLPPFPSEHAEESEAINEYVFGPYKDLDTTAITDITRARELLRLFGNSPRQYELIYVSNSHEAPPADASPVRLGYDVTNSGGDFYSLVGDFPDRGFDRFQCELNQFGLFCERTAADNFLAAYRHTDRPDRNDCYSVFEVWSVK
jgi:hypothetical protein